MEPTKKPRKASRFTWPKADAEFLEHWYGKIPLADLLRILNRTKHSVHGQAHRKGIKAQDRLKFDVIVKFKGKKYEVPYIEPRYVTVFNPDGSRKCTDTQRARATKAHKVLAKQKKRRIARPEPVEVKIKPFDPSGKTLVKIDNKTWAYR